MTMERSPHFPPGRRSGVAVWRQIADTLGDEIRNHRYALDQRLPSEAELSLRFGVNRHTVRQAVATLQADGLVRIEQGRGMFVQHALLPYPLARRTRFSENLQRQGLLPGKQLLAACEEPAGTVVAHELRLSVGDVVLRVETLAEANGQPVNLAVAYYPAARFAGLLGLLGTDRSTTDILRDLGVEDYVRTETRITTLLPTPETARLLKQPATRPLLRVESIDADLQGRPIKYGETVFCGDRVQLIVQPEGNAA